jgi:hypothetical protein
MRVSGATPLPTTQRTSSTSQPTKSGGAEHAADDHVHRVERCTSRS